MKTIRDLCISRTFTLIDLIIIISVISVLFLAVVADINKSIDMEKEKITMAESVRYNYELDRNENYAFSSHNVSN